MMRSDRASETIIASAWMYAVPVFVFIALSQAEEMYRNQQAIFVDARKSAFYSQQHITGATNLPVILFDLMYPMFQFMVEQEGKDKTLVVYGGTFSRRMDIDLARAAVLSADPMAVRFSSITPIWSRSRSCNKKSWSSVKGVAMNASAPNTTRPMRSSIAK